MIVRCGASKRRRRQSLAGCKRQRASVGLQLLDRLRVLPGIGQDGNVSVVFRRSAGHRGPANVDVLDDLFMAAAGSGHGRLERIEVAHDEIDGDDALGLERGRVLRLVAHGEDAAINIGVQRLDPPVEDLGKAGDLRDVAHLQAGLFEGLSGATGRDQLRLKAR